MGGEKRPESRGSMSLFGVLRLRLPQETAPNSAQDDEFNYENNFWDRTLEAGWVFVRYVEVIFEGEAGAGYGAFVEEAADEGDAVGDATGW